MNLLTEETSKRIFSYPDKIKVLHHYGNIVNSSCKYIVRLGEVIFLKPKPKEKLLSEEDYTNYLKSLLERKESFLYMLTNKENEEPLQKNIDVNQTKSYSSTDDYIKEINNVSETSKRVKKYKIFTFEIYLKLQKNKEFFVQNDTCNLYTIILNQDSILDYYSGGATELVLKNKMLAERKELVAFLHSTLIFRSIPEHLFEKYYFNLFTFCKEEKNKTIFTEKEPNNEIIIIKKGEFELYGNKSIKDLSNIINYLNVNQQFFMYEESKETIISKRKEMLISIFKASEYVGCFFYNFKGKSLFTLKTKNIDENFEYFSIPLIDFNYIIKQEELENVLNDYFIEKRAILKNQLISLKRNFFYYGKKAKEIVVPKLKVKQFSSAHKKKLENTYVDKSIFPLEKHNKKRLMERPHFKFVQNLVKFVIKKNKTKKKYLSQQSSIKNLNLESIKQKFKALNTNKLENSQSTIKGVEENSEDLFSGSERTDHYEFKDLSASKDKISVHNSFQSRNKLKLPPNIKANKVFRSGNTTLVSKTKDSSLGFRSNKVVFQKPFLRLNLLTLENFEEKFEYRPKVNSIFSRYSTNMKGTLMRSCLPNLTERRSILCKNKNKTCI